MRAPPLPSAVKGLLQPVQRVWRRSLQTRVVASTVVLSAMVVGVVGWLLLDNVTDGLVASKVKTSVREASSETAVAQDRLSSASGTDFDATGQLRQLVESIITRGEVRGFAVLLIGPVDAPSGSPTTSPGIRNTPGLDTGSVPAALLRSVAEADEGTSWTFGTIRYTADTGRPPVPGVLAGSRIELPADGGSYALVYLFPMEEEQRTLSLVTRSLLTGGALLLGLIGLLTWLVVRQVVTPVRLARRTAERLAAGRLEERMQVSGEDDLARLATAFNQMALSLQRQIRRLEELSRVQRRFVSDVSHELRTPLTTVRMASDVLHDARGSFDEVTARSAELLQTELDRFEGLLADLLEISRFDAGAAVLELDDIDLYDVAVRVADSARPVAERRGTRIVVERPDRPCLVQADVRRVERIVRNLVLNAVDYAEGGPVVIRLASDDTASALAVRDYGVGLAPGESAMVFNRFWRADPARARTSGGTGLGLSISLEDARLHGGWLQAWGQPGQGTQFRLTLPRRAGEELSHSPLHLVPEDAEVSTP